MAITFFPQKSIAKSYRSEVPTQKFGGFRRAPALQFSPLK